ncbi:MAG: phosphoenolpyruvate carboxykinase (ATP), partial [Candidatus Aenigmatarchaeota archaeon]
MDFKNRLDKLLKKHRNVKKNLKRENIIREIIKRKEAIVSESGALAVWTPPESTGRSPKDTYIVKNKETNETVDWTSPNCIPMDEETFE